MDRQDRLIYCQRCDHKKFDSNRGVICGLTNDIAKFNITCKDFAGNEKEVLKAIDDEEMRKVQLEELQAYIEADEKISVWSILKIIIAIIGAILGFLSL
ncbi:hypothetical protein IMCC3317_12750 [Kordia antarctica]|uniref:Uncharacterized protein n=1 Tax=Kordia antarctica TaxID=1218801 RepID=A0A7L4ZHH7_9FLAO|nr:hypothetical protein [Kordia antarctica]QHI35927.1 hypothetical protein IMCC3317_12750 [Kordia antarctica]